MEVKGFPLLIGSLPLLFLNLYIFAKRKREILSFSFIVKCSLIFIWLICFGVSLFLTSAKDIVFWQKLGHSAVIFFPPAFYHFVVEFLRKKSQRKTAILLYIISFAFLLFLWHSRYMVSGLYKYEWGFYLKAEILRNVFLVYFISVFAKIFLLLISEYKRERRKNGYSLFSNQIRYVLLGYSIGIFGSLDFLPNYGVDIYPFGFIFMAAFPCVFAYAIFKYRLMELSVAVTRAGIFLAVYAVVLAMPFWLGFKTGFWMVAVALMGILASLGPFVYRHLCRKAEGALLAEQLNYQKTLKKFAFSLVHIRDLDKLTHQVISKIMSSVNLQFVAFYLRRGSEFSLAFSKTESFLKFPSVINSDSKFASCLERRADIYLGEQLPQLKGLNLGLVLPLSLDRSLYGFILLGRKKRGFFTNADMDMFSILSSHISLALSEIYYFNEYRKAREKEHQLELEKSRLESASQISEAYRHELGNILNTISVATGDLMFDDRYQDVFGSVQRNIKRAQRVFNAISDYNNNSKSEFKEVALDNVLKEEIERQKENVYKNNIKLKADIERGINVLANGNLFFALRYLIKGAIRAMDYYNPKVKLLSISLKNRGGSAVLIISDTCKDMTHNALYTGVGIERGREGGIQYFIARRIVFDHRGRFQITSFNNEEEGTSFVVELPLAKAEHTERYRKDIF